MQVINFLHFTALQFLRDLLMHIWQMLTMTVQIYFHAPIEITLSQQCKRKIILQIYVMQENDPQLWLPFAVIVCTYYNYYTSVFSKLIGISITGLIHEMV